MKFALFILALIPLAYAYTLPAEEEEINEMMSLKDINIIKYPDPSEDCVTPCEERFHGFLVFLCNAACKLGFEKTHYQMLNE